MDFFNYILERNPWACLLLFQEGIFKKGAEIRKIAVFLLAPLLCLNILGCAPLIIVTVAAGALGGYAISKDTIQGETDKDYDSLWNAALTISKIRGNIKFEDDIKGYIELEADSSLVRIRLLRLTRATTRLRISARKYHLPNLALAQDMFVKIMDEAR